MRFNEIIDKVDELVNNISDFQYVYIYGAGKLAKMLVECLAEKNIHIAGVVTTCEPQDRNLDGILITAVDKLIIPENSVFLLATRVEFHTAILDTLINKKIRNIIPINKSLSWDIKRKYLLMRMNGRYELVESPYCALNHFTIAFKEKYRWRIHADISLPVINLINIWEKGLATFLHIFLLLLVFLINLSPIKE